MEMGMKRIANECFFAWVESEIKSGRSVKFRVKGNSMMPLLRNGKDEVVAKDGADHRAEPGDVQKLDEKNLVAGQFNVVHAVAPAFDRRETPEISSEHFFHERAVHEVPAEQQREAAPEIP